MSNLDITDRCYTNASSIADVPISSDTPADGQGLIYDAFANTWKFQSVGTAGPIGPTGPSGGPTGPTGPSGLTAHTYALSISSSSTTASVNINNGDSVKFITFNTTLGAASALYPLLTAIQRAEVTKTLVNPSSVTRTTITFQFKRAGDKVEFSDIFLFSTHNSSSALPASTNDHLTSITTYS